MVAFDKKSKESIVSKSYASIAKYAGTSLYLLHKHEAIGPVYETDTFIIYFNVLWVRAHEGK